MGLFFQYNPVFSVFCVELSGFGYVFCTQDIDISLASLPVHLVISEFSRYSKGIKWEI